MGTDAKTLTGPDLEAGVKVDGLVDGQPLLGHADGEAVMLVRRGEDVFATAATCTHYSGPLAEGLVVGDTVRCPWHHACFDLRTGRAIGAPALNDIACFDVQRAGGLVRVGKKRDIPAAKPAGASISSVVIVGAGPAGAVCAETLRKLG
jgi:apoptosis-inducing factor 3